MKEEANQFMQFSSADGELRLDAASRTDEELLTLAVQTARTGRRLVITNVSTTGWNLLERIAIAGQGNVLFDLR